MPPKTQATVLIVEDDPGIAELERERLDAVGYRVLLAATAEEALAQLRPGPIDLILLDYRLPDVADGLEFYARLKTAGHDVPVILVTGFGNEATVIRSLRAGVRDFITKSVEYLDYLPEAVERVLRQVQTEHQLAASEERVRLMVDSVRDYAILMLDPSGNIDNWNAGAQRIIGYTAEEIVGRHISFFYLTEDVRSERPKRELEIATARGRFEDEGWRVRKDGTRFYANVVITPVKDHAGHLIGFTSVTRDITERKRADELLRQSELQFREVWQKSVDGMRLTDSQGIVQMINDAYCTMVRKPREELVGKPFMDYYHEAEQHGMLDEYKRHFAARDIDPFYSKDVVLWDGNKAHFEFSNSFLELPGKPPQLLSILRDVTDEKRLEQQYRQAQKMEAFGQLSGGIAHDFNNLLTIINGYSEMLLSRRVPTEKQPELIREIRKAGERSASLTRQLLAFSRKQMLQPAVLDLNEVLSEAEKMLRRLIGEDINLATRLDPDLGRVKADPGQVDQVIMNLVVNARDAMPTGGHLTIETQNVELDDGYASRHSEVQPGQYVMLAVTDSGCGMNEYTKSKIFEPFFTTKEFGKGTGLGLATVHGIVRQSGGSIDVYSELGQGAAIKVFLPRIQETMAAGKSATNLSPMPKGSETILLAEDEEGVRRIIQLILQSLGYTVLIATNGNEALEICQNDARPIDLLLTDVVMPKMGGRQLVDRIVELRPKTKVLYLSGYTDDAVVRHGVLEAGVAFLQKPFTPSDLARKVRDVLGTS